MRADNSSKLQKSGSATLSHLIWVLAPDLTVHDRIPGILKPSYRTTESQSNSCGVSRYQGTMIFPKVSVSLQDSLYKSHLQVPCRSICDWDQIRIKRSKPFFESQSRNQGDLQTVKIKGSRTCSYNLTFDL